MFLEKACLISVIFAIAFAAPRKIFRPTIPVWYLPCGENFNWEVVSSENIKKELENSIENLRVQHHLTMNEYLNRDYEYLYENVKISIRDEQYIPTWVPNRKDANLVKKLANADLQTIVNHFPKLHQDLQKFAVAFEELIEDEPNSYIHKSLRATQSYLMMMLCEVESNIVVFPTLQLPARVERSIMNSMERNPEDETRRLIRDWGVLLKYRDYLHAWRHVFKY